MKKKGWIRETWPRENCREPVAHLNRKGAGRAGRGGGQAGGSSSLLPHRRQFSVSSSPRICHSFFLNPTLVSHFAFLAHLECQREKGHEDPPGLGLCLGIREETGPPGQEVPFWGSRVSTRVPREGGGAPIRKGLEDQAALGPFSAVNSVQSLSRVRLFVTP